MSSPRRHKSYQLTPDQYREILVGLKLRSIELVSCNMTRNAMGNLQGTTIKASFRNRAEIVDAGPGNVRILHTYFLTATLDTQEKVLGLKAGYLLTFASAIPIGQEFLEIFRDVSLAMSTWPFFRELVSSMTSRSGLPTLTLPLRISG